MRGSLCVLLLSGMIVSSGEADELADIVDEAQSIIGFKAANWYDGYFLQSPPWRNELSSVRSMVHAHWSACLDSPKIHEEGVPSLIIACMWYAPEKEYLKFAKEFLTLQEQEKFVSNGVIIGVLSPNTGDDWKDGMIAFSWRTNEVKELLDMGARLTEGDAASLAIINAIASGEAAKNTHPLLFLSKRQLMFLGTSAICLILVWMLKRVVRSKR